MDKNLKQTASLAQQLALWADQLRHMSALGLHFSKNSYDLENYERIQTIAAEMFALANGQTPAEWEPLRQTVMARPTPISVGDGAVIDENGRILLIQRADNQCWAMPGGALDVGETPAQGVVREVLEETGVETRVRAFIGVHDSRYTGGKTLFHLYHFLFLCTPLTVEPTHALRHPQEVLDVGWFAEDTLPADLDPGHVSRIPEAYRIWHGEERPYFDETR
jgi:ADP-ribose pyrophosphatase YjhB (NUDIX family)